MCFQELIQPPVGLEGVDIWYDLTVLIGYTMFNHLFPVLSKVLSTCVRPCLLIGTGILLPWFTYARMPGMQTPDPVVVKKIP